MANNFPNDLELALATLPTNLDRRTAAAAISKNLFPVSPRTLERWPVPTRRVNGRAVAPASAWFAAALAVFDASIEIAGHQASAAAGAL